LTEPRPDSRADQRPRTAEESGTSILEEFLGAAWWGPEDGDRELTRRALASLLANLPRQPPPGEGWLNRMLDFMITEIDSRVGEQVDEIIHHPEFQALEASWRGLAFLVDQTDFSENIRLEMLNVSKEDLFVDFRESLELVRSGLYRHVYIAEYGQFGGRPFGAIIADYSFDPDPKDLRLLQDVAAVAAMAHAPFLAAAGPEFFGGDSFSSLLDLKDPAGHFEGRRFAKWQAFRASEDSRYVGLVLPRFLLRLPYGPLNRSGTPFEYREEVGPGRGDCLWGNPVFALATRLTESFSRYRWCPNIIGPQGGGVVDGLPLDYSEALGRIEAKIPTEVLIPERLEFELSEAGFIILAIRKGIHKACFFAANSCQGRKDFGRTREAREAELNHRLGTQLPYMFIVTRLAHYLKVMQREHIGSWKEQSDIEDELNDWLRHYVSDMEDPQPEVQARRPLRQAGVKVRSDETQPGWYRVDIQIRPHLKYMGAYFTLSLVGKLDRE